MLKLLKKLHFLRGKIQSQKLELAAAQPEKQQREFLLKLLQKNSRTQFGRAHHFSEIKNEKDFRRQVPVRDYEQLRPYIRRIIDGEKSVLTAETPLMLTTTSGTTGEPKFIPVTRESQDLNDKLSHQWIYRAGQAHRDFLDGSVFGIASRAVEGQTAGEIPFGSISGLIYKSSPWFIKKTYAVPYPVFELDDYDERYFALARFALAREVSFIATPNPNTLLRFARVCSENQEKLIRHIHDGTLGLENSIHRKITGDLSKFLKPQPKRAKMLENIVKNHDFLKPSECWNLKLLGCWLGGTLAHQVGKLAHFYGDAPLRDLGYLASEGHFSVPIEDHDAAGLLALGNAYYEFVKEDNFDKSTEAEVFLPHELEVGARYRVLLTNAAGLYRYDIEDIIEVAGFHRRAPLVKFVRKAGETANITGEKMHVNHLIEAVEEAAEKCHLSIEQFRAAPDFDAWRYDIYIEPQNENFSGRLNYQVLDEIDSSLQRINLEYQIKRRSRRLFAPRLFEMKSGWSECETRQQILKRKRDTQYKWKILSDENSAPEPRFILQTFELENPAKIETA